MSWRGDNGSLCGQSVIPSSRPHLAEMMIRFFVVSADCEIWFCVSLIVSMSSE